VRSTFHPLLIAIKPTPSDFHIAPAQTHRTQVIPIYASSQCRNQEKCICPRPICHPLHFTASQQRFTRRLFLFSFQRKTEMLRLSVVGEWSDRWRGRKGWKIYGTNGGLSSSESETIIFSYAPQSQTFKLHHFRLPATQTLRCGINKCDCRSTPRRCGWWHREQEQIDYGYPLPESPVCTVLVLTPGINIWGDNG
jgi:hypothetical protein